MGDRAEETQSWSDPAKPTVSRRQFLTAATTGGAGLALGALGGATVGGFVTRAQYETQLAQARLGYEAELTKLRALVALYEQLEKIGIDAVVTTGMNIVSGILNTLKSGVNLLRDGITAAEDALIALQGMIDTLHTQADRAAQALGDLMQSFQSAQDAVGAVLGKAQPLGDAVGGFFSAILERLPFGVGERFQRAFDALGALIRAIPSARETVTSGLLNALTNTLFPTSGTSTVQAGVLNPLRLKLLEPLERFLGEVDKLLSAWDRDFTTPVRSALDQRQQVRNQIADYRRQNKL